MLPLPRARRCAQVGSARVTHLNRPSFPSTASRTRTSIFGKAALPRLSCTSLRELHVAYTREFSSAAPASTPHHALVDDFRAVIKDQGLFAAETKLQTLIAGSGAPGSDVFAVFLQEYARRKFAPQMLGMWKAMQASGIPLNRHGYNHFLSLYAGIGDIQRMEEMLHEMTAQAHPRSALTYKALFTGYAKARLLSKALRTFADMNSAGYKPDLKMHNELLTAYVKANKLSDAEQLLFSMQREGPKPDIVSYNILLAHLGSRRLHAPLVAMWADMEAANIPADARTYALVVASAQNFTNLIDLQRIPVIVFVSLIYRSFTILIEALAQPQHWAQAMTLITEVNKRNIKLDTPLVNVLIDAYGRGGYMDAMWRLYRGMRASDLEPTAITFTSMANAHLLTKDLLGIRRVYKLAQAAGVALNGPLYTTLLRGFHTLSAEQDFHAVLAELKADKKITWDAPLCAVLASRFGRQANASALRELEGDIKRKRIACSPRLFAALVSAYARAQDFVSAMRVYTDARALGNFDDGLHPPYITALARAGRLGEMERVFSDVPRTRYAQLEALLGAMMKAYVASGQKEKATELQKRVESAITSLREAQGSTVQPKSRMG